MSVTGININLTLRQIKGSELTYAELDGNQSGLKTAVESHSHDEFAADDHNHVYADITDAPAAYSLPTASTTVLGGVKVDGTSVVINNGVISSTAVGGEGGVTDHGALTGLTDDDHPQYHNDARGDARYSQLGHTHNYAPALGADDNYVTDTEKAALHGHSNKTALDNVSGINTGDQDLSGYSLTTHDHSGVYEPADSTILKDADIGVSVQAYDADLTSWAGIAPSAKQDALVSGTNIKTINGTSLLGSGNLTIEGSGSVTLVFPFYKANGFLDTIQMTSGYELPFYKADGNADNIVMVTP